MRFLFVPSRSLFSYLICDWSDIVYISHCFLSCKQTSASLSLCDSVSIDALNCFAQPNSRRSRRSSRSKLVCSDRSLNAMAVNLHRRIVLNKKEPVITIETPSASQTHHTQAIDPTTTAVHHQSTKTNLPPASAIGIFVTSHSFFYSHLQFHSSKCEICARRYLLIESYHIYVTWPTSAPTSSSRAMTIDGRRDVERVTNKRSIFNHNNNHNNNDNRTHISTRFFCYPIQHNRNLTILASQSRTEILIADIRHTAAAAAVNRQYKRPQKQQRQQQQKQHRQVSKT